MNNKIEEITLTDKQLLGLKHLEKLDLSKIDTIIEKTSIVGRFFQWVDDNILSKTTRLWMYCLEASGTIIIFTILHEFQVGFKMILNAQTQLEIQKAQMLVDAVTNAATPLATMVATICGGIPVVMGVFRSLKKKWENGSPPSEISMQQGEKHEEMAPL